MKEDIFYKAQDIKSNINNCNANINVLEKIIDYWEKNNITLNNDVIRKSEKSEYFEIVQHTTHISVMDNKANVQISNLELPIEALQVALKFHKDQKEKLEKEFENL